MIDPQAMKPNQVTAANCLSAGLFGPLLVLGRSSCRRQPLPDAVAEFQRWAAPEP
jgi:hypothetical protein